MNRQITRWRVSALSLGSNIRSDLGGEEELRRLGKSLKKRQQTPLHILPDGTVIDGHRRLAAARLAGIEELDCIVIDGEITPAEIEQIQLISCVHRADLPAFDKAQAVRGIKAAHPEMSNRQLADEVLDIDAGTLTRYLSLFDCSERVQASALAKEIGLSDWYAISRAPDQDAALAKALHGATVADLEREGKRQRHGAAAGGQGNGQPVARLARIKIPLATEAITGTVTLAGQDEIDLDAAEALLKEAMKAVRSAREKNLDPKTAQAVWKDMAKAG